MDNEKKIFDIDKDGEFKLKTHNMKKIMRQKSDSSEK